MPRDVSLSDRKCWNGGQKLVKVLIEFLSTGTDAFCVYWMEIKEGSGFWRLLLVFMWASYYILSNILHFMHYGNMCFL